MSAPDESKDPIHESELLAFIEALPESALPHLTEREIEEEYRHHYGR